MFCSRTRPVSCPCSSRTLESLFGRCLASNTFKVFREGDEAEIRRVFTVQDVQNFVDFTGDTNPIHVNVNFAKKTRFGQLVIHGVLLNWYVSFPFVNLPRNYFKMSTGLCLGDQRVRYQST